jgi:nitroreductase
MSRTDHKLLTVSEAVSSRHSCRKFSAKDVSLDLIMKILDEARYCPSNSNMQPWKIYVISGETKTKLTSVITHKFKNGQFGDLPLQFAITPGGDTNNPLNTKEFAAKYPALNARRSALGKLVYSAQGISRNDPKGRMKHILENFEWFGAPIGLLLTIDKGCGYGLYPDLGIIIQTVMLLCEQYGLSTICQVAWSLWHQTLRQTLDISDHEVIFCGVPIGYKQEEAKVNQVRTERMPLSEMVLIPKIDDNEYNRQIQPISKVHQLRNYAKMILLMFQSNAYFPYFKILIFIIFAMFFVWIFLFDEFNPCHFC